MTKKVSKTAKTTVVAFKVEQELAELLNSLPNKSAFIRKAIAAQLGVSCPLCKGAGVVTRVVNGHFLPLMEEFKHRACAGCGDKIEVPFEADDLSKESRSRMEQFLLGGPLYCNACYVSTPSCNDCGWHMDKQQLEKHHLANHCDDNCEADHEEPQS